MNNTTNQVTNNVPYLRTTRQFPEDLKQLAVEINKGYIDIANAVNNRTISIFPSNVPSVTGESWFITSQRQQTFRQIYSFGAISPGTELDIRTNISPSNVLAFTKIYGTVITTIGSNSQPDFRPLPYVDPTTNTTGMTILVGNVLIGGKAIQCIRIVLGSTAVPVTSGIAVLEWLSQV